MEIPASLDRCLPVSVEDFHRYRRNLPHWRQTGSTYWVTWRLGPGTEPLPAAARDIIAQAIRNRAGVDYKLVAFVVMDDHVHVIVVPGQGVTLQRIVQAWKSVSSHRINNLLQRAGALWLDEYFDRIVRDEDELFQKCHYILNNPRKRWPEVNQYPWVYCAFEEGINPYE